MKSHMLSREVIQECQRKLISLKQELLNRARVSAMQFSQSQSLRTTSGDEIDQATAQLEEHSFLASQDRMRHQILEVEMALARIENGSFGICEETEEIIETDRLMAVPWTRLSIEGAELREAVSRKYAR